MEDTLDLEDEVQDWRDLSVASGPVLPKRGEKDFEPDGTHFQTSILHESREAMYAALGRPRGHAAKQSVHGVYHQLLGMASVGAPKGPFFKSIGTADKEGTVWLFPEEVLYLCERGSMSVATEAGVEMSLEHLYGVVYDGRNDPDHYQVYAQLRRQGYVVRRHEPRRTEPAANGPPPVPAFWGRTYGWMMSTVAPLWGAFRQCLGRTRWFQALVAWGVFPHPLFHPLHFVTSKYTSFGLIMRSLRVVPHHTAFLPAPADPLLPYQLTFDVWKPTPTFRKSNPPPADFQISVVNADRLPFPSLGEIQALFESSAYVKEAPPARKKKPGSSKELTEAQRANQERLAHLKATNQRLNFGYRRVLLALCSCGVISYIRLSELDFAQEEVYVKR